MAIVMDFMAGGILLATALSIIVELAAVSPAATLRLRAPRGRSRRHASKVYVLLRRVADKKHAIRIGLKSPWS
jgi:hypothetical protein